MVIICSHSCPCWDLKGERLHIHYCLPENLILRDKGIVSFVSYYNSLINNDSFDLNRGKRSSKALSDQNWTQCNWRHSAALVGAQFPFPAMSHTSHHQSHSADFIKVAAEVSDGGRKRGLTSPFFPPMRSLGFQDGASFPTQVQPPYPRKTPSPVLYCQAAGPGVHQVMRRKLERLCILCYPLIICHGSKHDTINGWTMNVTYFNAWRRDELLMLFRWCFERKT